MPIKISVFGATGRMGREVTKLAEKDSSLRLLPTLDLPQKLKKETKPDVVIDFSSPQGLSVIANWCGQNKVALVSGTTALTLAQEKELKAAAKNSPIFWSPNMSVGLNSMALTLKSFAKNFSMGEVAIEEIHHKNKKDNPSGTAKILHKIIKENVPNGVTVESPVGLRGGDVFGVHKVYFFYDGEVVTFEHQAGNRMIFAQGAIKVSKWIVGQKPGLYEMEDFLQKGKK
jgi:4-hydroxy-tetrahydrodipicolinate reductase